MVIHRHGEQVRNKVLEAPNRVSAADTPVDTLCSFRPRAFCKYLIFGANRRT